MGSDEVAFRKKEIQNNGYSIIEDFFTEKEINNILDTINKVDSRSSNFRKTKDLFAIRQFLKEVPNVLPLIFNKKFKAIISQYFGENYFVVKSIYFDKPEESNWYVSYHQDLTISVKEKVNIPEYTNWTVKQNQFAVQPPIDILEDMFTIRIHLDDTDELNGSLKVIPGSHNKQILRSTAINMDIEKESICKINAGGIMIMKPLLLHSSGKTLNAKKRRVIHIEFCSLRLPKELTWAELI